MIKPSSSYTGCCLSTFLWYRDDQKRYHNLRKIIVPIYARECQVGIGKVIKGWDEALLSMKALP